MDILMPIQRKDMWTDPTEDFARDFEATASRPRKRPEPVKEQPACTCIVQ